MTHKIENILYAELVLGQVAKYTKLVTEDDVIKFSQLSGDVNPVHLNEEYALGTIFKGRIAHGMLTGAIISAAIALKMPGPGSVYLGQTLSFRRPVRIGDTITVSLSVLSKHVEVNDSGSEKHIVTLNCEAVNQDSKIVAAGEAEVLAPTSRVSIDID